MPTAKYFMFMSPSSNTSISMPVLAGEVGGSSSVTSANIVSANGSWSNSATITKREFLSQKPVIIGFNAPRNIAEIRFSAQNSNTSDAGRTLSVLTSNDAATWVLYSVVHPSAEGGDISIDGSRPPVTVKGVDPNLTFARRTPFQRYPDFSSRRTTATPMKYFWSPVGGGGTIFGTTTVDGELRARVVHLLDQKSMKLVATAYTKEDGEFEFNNLSDREYTVIGEDQTRVQNSVIYARVKPVFR